MEYREIVSVTGMGGLYQLLSTKSDGAVVRNITDGTSKFISARIHNVTPLESIEIYTTGSNVRLHEVLDKMKQSSQEIPDAKKAGPDTIRKYFREVFPDLDEDRVYVSDMKKMIKWFLLLQEKDLLHFTQPEQEEQQAPEETPAKETDTVAEDEKEAPVKKAPRKKKAAAVKEEETTGDPAPAAPVKKAPRKKKEA